MFYKRKRLWDALEDQSMPVVGRTGEINPRTGLGALFIPNGLYDPVYVLSETGKALGEERRTHMKL